MKSLNIVITTVAALMAYCASAGNTMIEIDWLDKTNPHLNLQGKPDNISKCCM